MMLRLAAVGLTDLGKVRNRNEDAFHYEPDAGIAVVADGMGGAPAGDLASRAAVEAVIECLQGDTGAGESAADIARQVEAAVHRANQRVLAMAQEDPERKGMGCTLTALKLNRTSGAFAIAHVGDSRAYRFRDGVLERLTVDHTVAQESVDEGRIEQDAVRDHPFGHVLTRVIGTETELEPMVIEGTAKGGDTFLLCTDGLVRVVDDEEVRTLLSKRGSDLKSVGESLVSAVHERGAPDNATLVLLSLAVSIPAKNGPGSPAVDLPPLLF